MVHRCITSLFFLLCAVVATVVAGGSIYSRFGVGDLSVYGSMRAYGMGGLGIGLIGDGFINRLNPAGLSRLRETRLAGGFEYVRIASEDAGGSGGYGRGEFNGLAFAIPIERDYGITLLLESSPVSTVRYAVERADEQGGITSKQRIFGTGGLSALSIGASYSPLPYVSTGVKVNYVFGALRSTNRISFDDPSYLDSDFQRSRYHSGFHTVVGATHENLSALFGLPSTNVVTLGAVVSAPARLSVKEETFHIHSGASDTLRTTAQRTTLPLALGIGLSYLVDERYIFTGDMYLQKWSSENFSEQLPVTIRNSARYALGFELLPQRTADSYFGLVTYRAGVAYHQTYLQITGVAIDEWLLTGGMGLPVGGRARLDIALQFGMRGSKTMQLQRDTIFRLSLSLSASELWFLRFEED